jgi:sirohydrochlorin ferrochelatase
MAAHRDVQTLRATHAFAAVELAFLEEPPFVADSLVRIGDRPTVVLGLLANHGTHARDDLPALLTAADTRRHPPILLGIIGDDPGLQPVILAMINATPGA